MHKTVHPLHGIWLDFLDVEVRLHFDTRAFRVGPVTGRSTAVAELGALSGRFEIGEGFILTVCSAESGGRAP